MTAVLAIDQGTSSSRAAVFDVGGRLLGLGQRTFDQQFPRDGWVEQVPEVLWESTLTACRTALAQAGIEAGALAAVGLTNQRETTLVWDRETGEPLHNAIVWQDRRTAAHCTEIQKAGMAPLLARATGLVVDPYFSSTKIAWLLEHVPGLRARAEAGRACIGTVDSFLIWRLTRGRAFVTDATNASRTQLFNLTTQDWDPELLDYFAVPRAALPEVRDCAAEFGVCDRAWLGAEVPICGVAGDQQAALIGQACFEPGMTKSTYGTGCFVVTNTGAQRVHSQHGLLTTVAYRLDGTPTFAMEGSIFVAGAAIKWLRDRLGLIDTAADTEASVRRTGGDTGGVYVVPAFTGLGAPHWQPQARGVVCGLNLDSGRDEIVTATLQSVGYQTADLLDSLVGDGAEVTKLRVDGGMVVNDWLCQFLADVTNVEVERPVFPETTALGAAILALLGSGQVTSITEAGKLWRLERRFSAALDDRARERLLAGWQTAVARSLSGTTT